MTTPETQNPHARLLRELNFRPASVALFLDSELAALLDLPISDSPPNEHLLGEALLRDWLYGQRCPANLVAPLVRQFGDARMAELRAALAPCRHNPTGDWQGIDACTVAGADPLTKMAWEHALARVRDFLAADGLVAVIGGTKTAAEAIAIPFVLTVGEEDAGAVRDRNGRTVDHWTFDLARLRDWFGPVAPRVVLSCDCERQASNLVGGSFALPVLLAAARRYGRVGDYRPLSILATGALETGGVLAAVQGVAAKRRLADRLDCQLFVYCGAREEADAHASDTLGLTPGMAVEKLADTLGRHLDDAGLTTLDAYQAHERVRTLQREIHEGLVPLTVAGRRLDRYERVFAAHPKDIYSEEGGLYAQLLRGAIANHAGDPDAGCRHTREAIRLAEKLRNPQLYAHATAASVVSLTDLGMIAAAESNARQFRRWVETDFSGGVADRLYCRVVAEGVLGGQPLLQKGLFSPPARSESLSHLEAALAAARQACLPREIARDVVQIALWHALHQPEQAPTLIATAEEELARLGRDGQTSLQYLRNYRLLAAYRGFLSGLPPPADFAAWPLPESPGWLLALARKYRGALHAADGNPTAAAADFADACERLESEGTPLLRFIGATAALQAGESLRPFAGAPWRDHLQRARESFLALRETLAGIHCDAGWLARTNGLLAGEEPDTLPNPQRHYRY